MTKIRADAPEFSHPLSIDKIPAAGMDIVLDARPNEREALAKRFDLQELNALHAELNVLPPRHDGTVTVSGRLKAEVVQTCVVTLEPLPAVVDKEINTQFVPPGLVDNDDENIEPLDGTVIDLGELVAQHMATSLDPYPRKEGLPYVEAEFGEEIKPDNPFAQLLKLKDDKK